jgi:hyperosmotically inducible periplasmic protein
MFKRMSVVICSLAVVLLTAGPAIAQGDAAADAATTAAVKTKLLADTKVGGLGIDVDTKDNVVTLSGKVRSTAERTEALRLARTTTGVKNVVSKLVVDPYYKGITDKDDKAKAEIKDEAKDAKDATKGTTGKAVDATKKGAEKTGEAVKKGAEKTGDAAKKVGQETKNAAVKTEDVTADAATTAAVKTKLLGDTKVGGLMIDVDTKDNVVTLRGTVHSAEEKAEALRLARTTTGVKHVIDKLTITPKQ